MSQLVGNGETPNCTQTAALRGSTHATYLLHRNDSALVFSIGFKACMVLRRIDD